jgi:phage head maturation protease
MSNREDLMIPSEWRESVPQHRALALDEVEVSEGGSEEWSLSGRLVPYGVEVEIGPGVFEQFDRGAFSGAVKHPGRIKFRGTGVGDGHKDAPVIGHARTLVESADGLRGEFRIPRTPLAEAAMPLLLPGPNGEDPVLDELSIEFVTKPGGHKIDRRGSALHVRHHSARLLGVVPVPGGAYGRDAPVTHVRSALAAEREAALAKLRALQA